MRQSLVDGIHLTHSTGSSGEIETRSIEHSIYSPFNIFIAPGNLSRNFHAFPSFRLTIGLTIPPPKESGGLFRVDIVELVIVVCLHHTDVHLTTEISTPIRTNITKPVIFLNKCDQKAVFSLISHLHHVSTVLTAVCHEGGDVGVHRW